MTAYPPKKPAVIFIHRCHSEEVKYFLLAGISKKQTFRQALNRNKLARHDANVYSGKELALQLGSHMPSTPEQH